MKTALIAVAALCLSAPSVSRAADAPAVTLALVGDVMLGRDVARAVAAHSPLYPFEPVLDELRGSDLLFGNLEGPLTDRNSRFPRVNALHAAPQMGEVLARVGFEVLSLANNHAIDYGRAGLEQTLSVLDKVGIRAVGAGRTAEEAQAGVVITVRGLRVGFLAFSSFPYADFVHDPARASIAVLRPDAIREGIARLAPKCDVLVVSLHWGQEGERATSDFERETAHRAVDLGAKVVVGHHAHVRGEIERYKGGLIAYGLGNLVFDDKSYGGNEGYILRCTATAAGVSSYRAVPVRVSGCQAHLAP
jgi:poly-gamma-glutamate capsule biosynthesis protein CapA/YwtB (metallophosphatase superfamily)